MANSDPTGTEGFRRPGLGEAVPEDDVEGHAGHKVKAIPEDDVEGHAGHKVK